MDIHVNRYADSNLPWESSISPSDRSWVLFQPRDPSKLSAQLWHRHSTTEENGATVHFYAPAGASPEDIEACRQSKLADLVSG